VCLGLVTLTLARAQAPVADGAAPTTRAEEIEKQRREKSVKLEPDEPNRIERTLIEIKEKRILERVTAGIGGFRLIFGGLTTLSGFALGPEYHRGDLRNDQMTFRASARGSTKKFWLMESELDMPKLADNHLFVNLYAVHRNYPRIDYYGPGSNSAKTGRSAWALEDTSFQIRTGVQPFRGMRLGGIGRYLMNNVSYGRDRRFASTDSLFTEQTTPGIQFQTDYVQVGGFVQYDWRDNPGGPRSGGNYIGQYTSYNDIDRRRYSFSRVDLQAQQYIPFFNKRRVIALRAKVEATSPHRGDQVPFYLQPTLGGSDDLRGYRPFRFYDNNMLVMNGEYRWEIFSGLDMALFFDAGQVYSDWHDIHLRQLKKDAGFGFRFNVRNNVFMRIDTGFSDEGFQVWVKFNNVF
jgi:outer membrane protein assembly factor BamA